MNFRSFVSSSGLRDVPLSLGGVVIGVLLAAADYHVDVCAVLFLLLTVILICMLSYAGRQHGNKPVIWKRILILLTVCAGLLTIRFSFGTIFSIESFVLMLIGLFVVRFAMSPAAASGTGAADEILLVAFSGLVAVFGSYFIVTHSFGTRLLVLPALSAGLLTASVRNLQNIRDMETEDDARMTFAVKLGEKGARGYQTLLIVSGCVAMTVYPFLRISDPWHFMFVIILPVLLWSAASVWKRSASSLDSSLLLLRISIPLVCLLFGLGFIMFLILR